MEEFADQKQKIQFVALGMNADKRKESYQWILKRRQPKTALFFLSDLYALEVLMEEIEGGEDWNLKEREAEVKLPIRLIPRKSV